MANIGLAWVTPAPLTKPENVVSFAKKCEAMGCHSMWTIDRIAYDNLEPLTILRRRSGRDAEDPPRHLSVARQPAPSEPSRQDRRDLGFYFQRPRHFRPRLRQPRK